MDTVKLLLAHPSVKVDSASSTGVTALWAAAAEGHITVVKLLLAGGAQARVARRDGVTALMAACADANSSNNTAAPAAAAAAVPVAPSQERLETVRLLLGAGADLLAVDEVGRRLTQLTLP